MIQKKICMVGSFAVGKTSLVQRFVSSIFSDKYLTTVGVKIDKKTVKVDGTDVNLLLWDIEGASEAQLIRMTYMRGASGYLLVADGTRRDTLAMAQDLQKQCLQTLGPLPFTLLVNKCDLKERWEVTAADLDQLHSQGWPVLETSAKAGNGVEQAFLTLAASMVKK